MIELDGGEPVALTALPPRRQRVPLVARRGAPAAHGGRRRAAPRRGRAARQGAAAGAAHHAAGLADGRRRRARPARPPLDPGRAARRPRAPDHERRVVARRRRVALGRVGHVLRRPRPRPGSDVHAGALGGRASTAASRASSAACPAVATARRSRPTGGSCSPAIRSSSRRATSTTGSTRSRPRAASPSRWRTTSAWCSTSASAPTSSTGAACSTRAISFDADGVPVAAGVVDGECTLWRFPAAGRPERIGPAGRELHTYAAGGGRFAAALSDGIAPPEVYAIEDGGARRLTRSCSGWARPLAGVTSERVEVDGPAGPIPTWVVHPAGAGRKPLPTILSIHGGPTALVGAACRGCPTSRWPITATACCARTRAARPSYDPAWVTRADGRLGRTRRRRLPRGLRLGRRREARPPEAARRLRPLLRRLPRRLADRAHGPLRGGGVGERRREPDRRHGALRLRPRVQPARRLGDAARATPWSTGASRRSPTPTRSRRRC